MYSINMSQSTSRKLSAAAEKSAADPERGGNEVIGSSREDKAKPEPTGGGGELAAAAQGENTTSDFKRGESSTAVGG